MPKRVKESQPESGIVKVVDPLYDAPVAVEMAHEPAPPPGPSFGKRVRRFFEVLLRLISWVIIFTVFGAALYYGVPMLYQRFVAPVEQNTAQMAEMQSQQEQTAQELVNLQAQIKSLQDGQSQNVKSLTDLDERASVLDRRLGKTEAEIAAHTQSLASLEKIQSELQAQDEAASAELKRQIELMKSVELLSRARLFMYQSNFGLARQDVQAGRELLGAMHLDKSDAFADDLDVVVGRLDLVLSNLPNFPVAASDDLDIAWQILVSGLPEVQTPENATAVAAPTLSTTPEATSTPNPTATIQPPAP